MPAITMKGAIPRSRVQFHGLEMKKKRKDEAKINAHKQTQLNTAAQKCCPDGITTSTNAPVRLRQARKVATAGYETDSDSVLYEEDSGDVSKEVPSFSKQRVASMEEITHGGHFQSEIQAAVASVGSPSTACAPAIEEDPSDSPSASLVLTAPVYREVNGRLEPQSSPAPVTEQPPPKTLKNNSSSNWLTQLLVKLFAGRRRSVFKSHISKRNASSTHSYVPSIATIDQQERNVHPYAAQIQCAPTPPPVFSPPKLTHRQVIPTVTRPEQKDPLRMPIYQDEPCAPENRYTGYGVTAEDKFTPVTVQRGFNAPCLPPVPDALASRRNQSASSLLDREGDVWARWHTKYPTPESHPFIRSSSVVV